MLTDTVPVLRKLAVRENLTAEETRQTLNALMLNETDFYYTLAFAMGLMAKGPTVEELKGLVLSYQDRGVPLNPKVNRDVLIDISGTGGDKIKTPNVGTTASFIMAAGGLVVAKQSTRGYTGTTGSRDMFVALGVDIPLTNGDPRIVEKALEVVGLFPFYYPAFSEKFSNRVKFFTKLREIGLTFVTPWHLTSWVYSPLPLKYRVYGMFTDKYLEDYARLYSELGYEHVLIVNGVDGLDEVSNIGETKISELMNGKIRNYTISPKELGIKASKKEEILSKGADENALDFIRVIYGKEHGALTDLVAINAGVAFYATNKTKSMKEGTELAFELIKSGAASKKMQELVSYAGKQEMLELLLKKAGI
jgi:anthranilate phosphoribosyltransferase